jgi:ABC-type antimicrobial peptide transport system permease subunit
MYAYLRERTGTLAPLVGFVPLGMSDPPVAVVNGESMFVDGDMVTADYFPVVGACANVATLLRARATARQKQMGVGLAVGATRAGILALVLRRGAWLVVIGVVAGAAAAYPGTRLVRHLLFDKVPLDPAAYTGAVLTLGAVAATECLVPALRAKRLDPAAVLRGE